MIPLQSSQIYSPKSLPLMIVFFLLMSVAQVQAEMTKLPEFSLQGVNPSAQLNSADYAGKVLIVYFWTTWCPLCRKETKDFVELTKTYAGKDLQIIGISMDKSGEKVVLRFMDTMQVNYPMAMITPQIKAEFGPITGIPASFIFDKKGNLFKKSLGYMGHKKLVEDLESLLAE